MRVSGNAEKNDPADIDRRGRGQAKYHAGKSQRLFRLLLFGFLRLFGLFGLFSHIGGRFFRFC